MKTAEEKAKGWLLRNAFGSDSTDIRSLSILLKEQDRDTRHACAEAVLQCHEQPDEYSSTILDEANNACMNVKAV